MLWTFSSTDLPKLRMSNFLYDCPVECQIEAEEIYKEV